MKLTTALTNMFIYACLAVPATSFECGDPLQANWGRSFESAKYKQIIAPLPGRSVPVENLKGEAAVGIMQQYVDSFKNHK